nr:odorant receptor 4-like isoform X2 [Danaus plexippus plexippus]
MTKLSRVMFLLLCHITSIAKQIVFHYDADRIQEMIEGFDDPIYNGESASALSLLRSTTLVARRLERAYAGCAILTCTLWLVFPVLHRLSGNPVHFAFWTGIDTDPPAMFVAVLLYSYYVTTLVGIANTTMDAFIATILFQCKTQLTILRRVTETAALLQDIFGTAILVQFGIGGWILCMAAYKLVSLNVLSIEFASMTLFILCILTELFLYCYYGNELTVESELIVRSVYSMRWVSSPLRFQRLLLLLMLRVRRTLRPAAGRVIPLSLDTFVKILKSSYTFYAVLRQTK